LGSEGKELNIDDARRGRANNARRNALLGGVAALGLGATLSLTLGCAPAIAQWSYGPPMRYYSDEAPPPPYRQAVVRPKHKIAHKEKPAEHAGKEPFGNIPKGPLEIFVSINQQKLHVYSDGVHVADTSVATGVPSLPTPLGVFDVIQKQVFHRSNIYSNAPMPYMQRITWSGVAMHEGESIGHRASHGCIRMPHDFAVRLYSLTRLGARVIVARNELKPAEFADPHLFVHKDKPQDQAAADPSQPQPVKTAQSIDASKTVDVPPAGSESAAKPATLGLRVNETGSAAATASEPAADPAKPDPGAPDTMVTDAAKSDPADAAKSDPPPTAGVDAPAAATPDQKSAPTAVDANSPPGGAAPAGGDVPVPLSKPAGIANASANRTPISIFISRKAKKIYVRQNFAPLFDAEIGIDQPDATIGTHVFTAMKLLDDHTTFRWDVVSMPGEPTKLSSHAESERRFDKHAKGRRRDQDSEERGADAPPAETPAQALARIHIPQDTIDYISELMVPGSSLIVSDQGLGGETGEGTDFIVVTR
jgi:lipoprotein-anchoring transpeptidase ErfK/SrfK